MQSRAHEAPRGEATVLVGIVLIPFLRKLITDKAEKPSVEVPATVVPVA